MPASPMRYGSICRRRSRVPGGCSGTRPERGPMAIPAASRRDPAAWGDVVLARKETPTSYHLSVVVDDARQGVTDVVRGTGPVLVDQRAPAAAGAAGTAGAALSPPSAHARRGRPKARKIDPFHVAAGAAGSGRHSRRHPAHGGACLSNCCDRPMPGKSWAGTADGEGKGDQTCQEARRERRGRPCSQGCIADAHACAQLTRHRGDARRHRARNPHAADRHPGAGRIAGDVRSRRTRTWLGDLRSRPPRIICRC